MLHLRFVTICFVLFLVAITFADGRFVIAQQKSIREFGVLPTNDPATNKTNLQAAIDWATRTGGSLFVDPSDEPYAVDGGLVLKRNVSLVGVHGPTPRGTRHPEKPQPVGSVFKITDRANPWITVEAGTQIRGLQFWYAEQTLREPEKIVAYPATIRLSKESPTQGVTLSSLTFYGEYLAMDFRADRRRACELMLIEHCYGYPLGGTFIAIDRCYDIPRILHCHVNPAIRRFIDGQYSQRVVDAVIAKKSFAYDIDHTDNAQLIDIFTFGTYGGIRLGPATYGQLTNFNLDCVAVGILKQGDGTFNRNWQIAQGSIIANCGEPVENIHPIIIEGEGHTALANVEAFSGPNGALTTVGKSHDFLLIRGDKKVTVTLVGCRMRNYAAEMPLTTTNPKAVIQAVACIDRDENLFNTIIKPADVNEPKNDTVDH